MNTPFRDGLFEYSLSFVELVVPLVEKIARRDRDLASQLRRPLSSVALNLAEGLGSTSGTARARFESSLGSLYETRAAIRVAVAFRYLSAEEAAPALAAADRLGGRLFGFARR